MNLRDMAKLLLFARGLGGEVDTMHIHPQDAHIEVGMDEVNEFAAEHKLKVVLTDKCPQGRVYFSDAA